jgi:hypothetical protein
MIVMIIVFFYSNTMAVPVSFLGRLGILDILLRKTWLPMNFSNCHLVFILQYTHSLSSR